MPPHGFLAPQNSWLRHFVGRAMCETRALLDFATLHPVREMRKLALAETVAYIRGNMPKAVGAYTKREFLSLALDRVSVDGHYAEFGVHTGESLRFIASRVGGKTVFGFDSFEGLPEDWPEAGRPKGSFSLGGKLARVPSNVELRPGWFDASLPLWLEAHPGPMAFIHIDCDLYDSTKTIFDLLAPRIVPGTVIAFDEYFNYPNWQHHEFKAFQEYVQHNTIAYDYVAYGSTQAAVRVAGSS
jgi:hypothetical protein